MNAPFPPQPAGLNEEQLEAELEHLTKVFHFPAVSQAQMVVLILACQHTLRADPLGVEAGRTLLNLARGLEKELKLTPGCETAKLIAAGWKERPVA